MVGKKELTSEEIDVLIKRRDFHLDHGRPEHAEQIDDILVKAREVDSER